MKRTAVSIVFVFLLTLNLQARWRDEGQSEKYMLFWEDKFKWETSAIEGYKLLLDQNYEPASVKLQEAISRGCPLGKVYFQLGLALDKLNQTDQASQNYVKALKIFESGTQKEKDIDEYLFLTHHNLGIIKIEQGLDEEAVLDLEKAKSIRPNDASTQVNLGYLYSKNRMDEKAMDAYRSALQLDPQLAVAHYNLGVLLRRMGQSEAGTSHIEKARDLDPSIRENVRATSETTEIKDPHSLSPEEIELIRQRAEGEENLTAVGNLYYALSQFDNAISMYDQAIAENAGYTHAYVGKGRALLALEDPFEAQKVLFKALELEPNNVEGHIQLGKVYYDQGRVQMSKDQFLKAYELDHQSVELLFYLGVVHEYYGDERYGTGFPAEEAKKFYEEALARMPNHLPARTNLANVYAKLGDWDRAKQEFEKASQAASNSAYAHYNLGYIYDELGLRRQSIQEYLKAVELDPKFADAFFNLGYVYSEFKLFKFAERQYYRVLDIDHNYADAYFNLGVLYDRYLKENGKAHTYYHEYALRVPNAPKDEKKILKKRILKLYP